MPGDPIFDKSDTAVIDELPAELQGKTPQEVAAYYQRREQILLERSRPKAPAKEEIIVDDKIDLFNDPSGSVNRVVDRKVGEAMNRMAATGAPAIINSCKISLKDAHPADYARFISEVEKRMSGMSVEAQMNPQYWELTYTTVKGEVADKLVEEARVQERAKRDNPVEKGSTPGEKPPKPRELSEEEKVVARKFSIDNETYRTAADRYESTDGKLPFTFDSRLPKKRKSA